jgi:hypothetical protein
MSQPESLRDIALRLLREYRAKRENETFCALVEQCERERTPVLELTAADRQFLKGIQIDA